uniref:Putative chorion peroxidase n=1 Tax=Anopheles braziliensis TaxID=58242 RepID=A0A2M3ZDU9_9DIPT
MLGFRVAILVSLLSSFHALELTDRGVDRYELEPRLTEHLNRFASASNVEESLNYGQMVVEKSIRAEGAIVGGRDRKINRGGVAYAQLIDGYPTPDTERQDRLAGTVLRASSYFVNRYCASWAIPSYECGLFLSGIALPESSPLYARCRSLIEAKEHNDQYRRLLPAVYDDGIYSFRRSVTGQELPSARVVSSKFHSRTGADDNDPGRHTAALVQWSQFIEHDLAKTTVQTMHDGADIECCTMEHGPLLPRYRHPAACAPIPVPVDDPFYREHRATCLNYVRSARSLGDSCQLGPANQLNAATAHLDLSQLYGSTVNESMVQRTHQGGRLRSQQYDSLDYLPDGSASLCVTDEQLETICYSSGDSRVNVNPYVTLLHTLFLRSHNRLAKHLALVAPQHWTDEQLFTVARLVNTRVYRKIVREWLTTITGSGGTRSTLDQDPQPDQTAQQRVSNEFATAAIRFYHTMMPGTVGNVPLQTLFYRPKDLRKRDYFRQLIDSVLHQSAMALDTAYVDEVAHLLFGSVSRQIGLDVLALDIQRGRDHGLARYVDYYALCNGGDRIDDWNQLESVMRPDDLAILRSTYARVEDVDLIVGGVAERPKATAAGVGAIVGPTFSCLIREQIERSLTEEKGQAGAEIDVLVDGMLKDYGAARFMCDTAPVDRVQRDIFRLPSPVDNPSLDCSQLPSLDLTRLVQALDVAAGGWPQLRRRMDHASA